MANGNFTFELTINQVDEFARRRLDWLVVNDKQPQVQLYINLKDKPDHCLLLLHTELVQDPVNYIKAIDLPFEHVDSRKANKRDHREVILHKSDWEIWRQNLVTLMYTSNHTNNIDLPVLKRGALAEAYQRFTPWLQDVTNDSNHCRLYLAPDSRTYILEPKTEIWPELVGKTIAFTGSKPGN